MYAESAFDSEGPAPGAAALILRGFSSFMSSFPVFFEGAGPEVRTVPSPTSVALGRTSLQRYATAPKNRMQLAPRLNEGGLR